MKILLIDNYDSFTYNLHHLIQSCGAVSIDVIRNDKLNIETPQAYDKIVFSPGPGIPSEAGLMPQIIQAYAAKKPLLGVCLGHQAIGEAFGFRLRNLDTVFHGIATDIFHSGEDYIFKNIPGKFKAARYHSWVVDENSSGRDLEVIARDENGLIMALAHTKYDIRGLQFHPESVLTEHSHQLITNWLQA